MVSLVMASRLSADQFFCTHSTTRDIERSLCQRKQVALYTNQQATSQIGIARVTRNRVDCKLANIENYAPQGEENLKASKGLSGSV